MNWDFLCFPRSFGRDSMGLSIFIKLPALHIHSRELSRWPREVMFASCIDKTSHLRYLQSLLPALAAKKVASRKGLQVYQLLRHSSTPDLEEKCAHILAKSCVGDRFVCFWNAENALRYKMLRVECAGFFGGSHKYRVEH